jgi:hypothetical protein
MVPFATCGDGNFKRFGDLFPGAAVGFETLEDNVVVFGPGLGFGFRGLGEWVGGRLQGLVLERDEMGWGCTCLGVLGIVIVRRSRVDCEGKVKAFI